MEKIGLKKSCSFVISSIIIIGCITFVAWQSCQCIMKFIDNPQGTKLGIEYAGKHPYPAITVCGDYKDSQKRKKFTFNEKRLKECKINNWDLYTKKAEWVPNYKGEIIGDNENCTDPQKLFEYIVSKPEDLIMGIKYYYFDKDEADKFYPNDTKVWSIIDDKKYGRCFTATPTPEMSQHGLQKIHLYLIETTEVFFHPPGMFQTDYIKPSKLRRYTGQRIELDLVHEAFDMLDFGGDLCVDDENYKKDMCVHNEIERKAVKMYGCTTPYGPHKDQICKNKENGTKVFDKYVETIDGHKYDCKNPCKYIISRPFITSDLSNQPNINGQKVAYFKIYFKRNIKFTRAHYLYSELSLIAEIGGYVGLFLGVSVNQITMLMDIAFGWFDTFCNSKHLN